MPGPDTQRVQQRQEGLRALNVRSILIAGGGNLGHACAAFLSRNGGSGCCVSVLTTKPEKWNKNLKAVASPTSVWCNMKPIYANLKNVSSDPSIVVPDADAIFVAAPVHAHLPILEKIAPFVKEGAFVGTVFGQGCFDLCVRSAFGSKINKLRGYFALLHVPWLAYIKTYGQEVQIIGPKDVLLCAAMPKGSVQNIRELIQLCFEKNCSILPNFLSNTLTPSNQIIHPARYYELFKDWDGVKVYKESEIQWGLYSEFGDIAADLLQNMDDELQKIKNTLQLHCPSLDLSYVKPIKQRIVEQYGIAVGDPSTLKSVFRTNRGYAGCRTPAQKVPGGYLPAIRSRLFEEDIPHGLCVLKNLAELLNVETPVIDLMIEWHQKFMNKKFIINGKLNPETLHLTSTPARFGIRTLKQLVDLHSKDEQTKTNDGNMEKKDKSMKCCCSCCQAHKRIVSKL